MTMLVNDLSGGINEVLIEKDLLRSVRKKELHGSEHISTDLFMCPGFFDIQVNGFGGIDFNGESLTEDHVLEASHALLKTGVTRYLPTLITNNSEIIRRSIEVFLQARNKHEIVNEMFAGFHLEGPFISSEDGPRGAHSKEFIKDPDWKSFYELIKISNNTIRLVTLAPEKKGAISFIEKANEAGLVVAIGHSNPQTHHIDNAVKAGAQLITHLGNGAHAMLNRTSNYVLDLLANDNLYASIICDGHHLSEAFVKIVFRTKGSDRVILITDAMAAAAAGPGQYNLAGLKLVVGSDGVVRLPNSEYLAGSSLTMPTAIVNCIKFAGCSFTEAIQMVTNNPARLLGINSSNLMSHSSLIVKYTRRIFKVEKVIFKKTGVVYNF